MSGLLYGYTRSEIGIIADIPKAKVVDMIYDAYLSGLSLGRTVDMLHEKQIPSPSGKERWSTAVLFDILTDGRYVHLVGFERFVASRFETDRRSRFDQDTGKRKATRYHSINVLSGLFVCSECGRSYRRVQRASGEMVWRCANRVEHGNRICKSAPTITEEDAIQFICKAFDIPQLDQQMVRNYLDKIIVNQDGSVKPELIYSDPLLKLSLLKLSL
jgi:hypothetical protein